MTQRTNTLEQYAAVERRNRRRYRGAHETAATFALLTHQPQHVVDAAGHVATYHPRPAVTLQEIIIPEDEPILIEDLPQWIRFPTVPIRQQCRNMIDSNE